MSRSGAPATDNTLKTNRVAVIFAVACAVTVFGSAAEGQTVTRSQNSRQTEVIAEKNPCNGRLMSGEGTVHTQVNQSANGDITNKKHVYGQLVEVGDPTQRYQYQSWDSDRTRVSSETEFTLTVATRKHVIHEGKRNTPLDGSYFQWVEFTTDQDLVFTIKQSRAECKSESGTVNP